MAVLGRKGSHKGSIRGRRVPSRVLDGGLGFWVLGLWYVGLVLRIEGSSCAWGSTFLGYRVDGSGFRAIRSTFLRTYSRKSY